MKNKIYIFELIIIAILLFAIICVRFSIKNQTFKEKFEKYNEYVDKFSVKNTDLIVYETTSVYDPNTDISYYRISILNNSDDIKEVKKIKIITTEKSTKKKKTLEYSLDTEISPNTYINFTYEYNGVQHEKKYYKVEYEFL